MKISITTKEILIPKKPFKAKSEKDLEFDTTIAEFCPDIARLIRVDCTPFAESCVIENDKAVLKGRAVYDVLYETDYKNRLKFCSFTQEFTHSAPLPKSMGIKPNVFCQAVCRRINCKLLSPRRLVIKSVLSVNFDVDSQSAVKVLDTTPDAETFFLTKEEKWETPAVLMEQSYDFGDNLALTQNEKSIGEIVCGNILLQEPQVTLSNGRAEIKTTATIKALCEEESNEGHYYMASKILPLNIDYRNETINENKQISANLEVFDAKFTPELDQYGESRMIKADFNVKMCLKTKESVTYTLAEDMFEKEYDSIPVLANALLPKSQALSDAGFSAEAKLEEMIPKPEMILDSLVKENSINSQIAEGGINLSGNFAVTLLAQTQEGIYSFDHIVPYNQFIPAETPKGETEITAEVYPIEIITTLHSDGTATARIIASARIFMRSEKEISFISDIAKHTKREKEDMPNLIYRFPEKGEYIWDMAKHYRIDPKSISASNPDVFDEKGITKDDTKPILIKT